MKYWILLALVSSGTLMADEQATSIPAVDPVSTAYLVKITLGLVFILLLIFGLAWIMKKMHLTPQSSNQMIRILSAVSVGSRDRIALVEVGGEQILVGLTPGRIEKLHALATPLSIEDTGSVSQRGFREKFTRLMHPDQTKKDRSHDR